MDGRLVELRGTRSVWQRRHSRLREMNARCAGGRSDPQVEYAAATADRDDDRREREPREERRVGAGSRSSLAVPRSSVDHARPLGASVARRLRFLPG